MACLGEGGDEAAGAEVTAGLVGLAPNVTLVPPLDDDATTGAALLVEVVAAAVVAGAAACVVMAEAVDVATLPAAAPAASGPAAAAVAATGDGNGAGAGAGGMAALRVALRDSGCGEFAADLGAGRRSRAERRYAYASKRRRAESAPPHLTSPRLAPSPRALTTSRASHLTSFCAATGVHERMHSHDIHPATRLTVKSKRRNKEREKEVSNKARSNNCAEKADTHITTQQANNAKHLQSRLCSLY